MVQEEGQSVKWMRAGGERSAVAWWGGCEKGRSGEICLRTVDLIY